MRLRPVNVIFYEPKFKFIVIYQNGQLWQLPRMKIDINSWRNRKTYKGTKTALYLNKEQKIQDAKLSKIVRTEDFPSTLTNMNLPKFESWWLANSYEWLKAKNSASTVSNRMSNIKESSIKSSPNTSRVAQQQKSPLATRLASTTHKSDSLTTAESRANRQNTNTNRVAQQQKSPLATRLASTTNKPDSLTAAESRATSRQNTNANRVAQQQKPTLTTQLTSGVKPQNNIVQNPSIPDSGQKKSPIEQAAQNKQAIQQMSQRQADTAKSIAEMKEKLNKKLSTNNRATTNPSEKKNLQELRSSIKLHNQPTAAISASRKTQTASTSNNGLHPTKSVEAQQSTPKASIKEEKKERKVDDLFSNWDSW